MRGLVVDCVSRRGYCAKADTTCYRPGPYFSGYDVGDVVYELGAGARYRTSNGTEGDRCCCMGSKEAETRDGLIIADD